MSSKLEVDKRELGPVEEIKTLVSSVFQKVGCDEDISEFVANSLDAVEARVKQVLDTPEEVFLSVFSIYAATEMLPWLPHLDCPCLVMTGELDAGCSPVLNKLIADTLPNAELVILENLKHSILIEGTEKVLPPLRDFLVRNC